VASLAADRQTKPHVERVGVILGYPYCCAKIETSRKEATDGDNTATEL